jgi:hypothetical protein
MTDLIRLVMCNCLYSESYFTLQFGTNLIGKPAFQDLRPDGVPA